MRKELYLIRVLTPLHVGSGAGLGHIDLPIYREAHTDFPAIPASAVKGAIRTKEILRVAKEKGVSPKVLEEFIEEFPNKLEEKSLPENVKEEASRIACYFGSKNREGSLVFTDARILFFPVKSLKGIYALITCPYVLNRFAEETDRKKTELPDVDDSSCVVFEDSKNLVDERLVVLEEFAFEAKRYSDSNKVGVLKDLKADKSRIVILSDSVFSHMVKSYTEVQTHIKVDIETGTVNGSALWTEEYIPAEAVFYFLIFKEDKKFSITNGKDRKVLQLGGNYSTGKGFVEVWRDGDQEP